MFLRYDSPWWHLDLGSRARAVTDLPIRQVYYLAKEGQQKGPALVMASYSDEHYVDFWEPLFNDLDRVVQASTKKELAITQGRDVSRYVASERMIKKAESQLQILHPGRLIPETKEGLVQHWKNAWHFWNVHSKPWETAEALVQPFDGCNLFTCGEAYSLEQGWVEGALKSAERVILAMGCQPVIGDEGFGEYICN